MSLPSRKLPAEADVVAPDGSQVRILVSSTRGSMAHFTLEAGAVARPVAHRTIEEVWFVVSGAGRMWRRLDGEEDIVELRPGVSLALPVGTHFQFRSDGDGPLAAVGVAMPPWPGDDEAYPVKGPWPPTV
jgi:mannose-6-phosphate isomerase-like protein (cupin superfamily)